MMGRFWVGRFHLRVAASFGLVTALVAGPTVGPSFAIGTPGDNDAVAVAGATNSGISTDAGSFHDDNGGVHEAAIDALAEKGILEGTECGRRLICPEDPIKRWVAAVWLVRSLGKQPADGAGTRFADLDAQAWWTPYVDSLADLGVTRGCGDDPPRFCPDEEVTRAQMASLLVRALDLGVADSAGFADTGGIIHEAGIDALASAGITAGCSEDPPRYCPDKAATRGQMASFLARAVDLAPRTSAFSATTQPPTVGQTDTTGHYVGVSAGRQHSCAIRTDGVVECWGNGANGRLEVPEDRFSAVAAGGLFSCGLRMDGTVLCWGETAYGEQESEFEDTTGYMRAPVGTFTEIDAGFLHACGIHTDGTIDCWGDHFYWQLAAPEGRFSTLTAGVYDTCGLRIDGATLCWGLRTHHQDADVIEDRFTAIATGDDHSCGIRADGTVMCWGDASTKVLKVPRDQFSSITAGDDYSCGIQIDGTVVCWGDASYGQLEAPEGKFSTISTGNHHSCGIHVDGPVICWGDNRYGHSDSIDRPRKSSGHDRELFPGPGVWRVGSQYRSGEHNWTIPDEWDRCSIGIGRGDIWVTGVLSRQWAFGQTVAEDIDAGSSVRVTLVDWLNINCYRPDSDRSMTEPIEDESTIAISQENSGLNSELDSTTVLGLLGEVYDGSISKAGTINSYVFEIGRRYSGTMKKIETFGPTDVKIDLYRLFLPRLEYLVYSDDDSGQGRNAFIYYEAEPGWYRVDVGGYRSATGIYSIRFGSQGDAPREGKFISVIASLKSERAAHWMVLDLRYNKSRRVWYLDSSRYESLHPGYWVVFAGPFDTAAEAQHACWSELNMRSPAVCYGRRLSQDPEDVHKVYPPKPRPVRS